MGGANPLTAELLVRIPERFPQARVWRNNRIKAMAVGRGGRPRMVDAGVNGQADISGIAGPLGRRLEIEVKAGKDVLSQDQIRFGNMIRERGGVYLVAREVDLTLNALAEQLGV
jgi:predicted RecB family endonuclease